LPSSFRFVLCWLTIALLVTLSTQTRHSWYLLPIYPPLCVLIAGMGTKLWRYSLPAREFGFSCPLFLRRVAAGLTIGWFCFLPPGHVRWVADSLTWIEELYWDRNALLQELGELLNPDIPLCTVGLPMPGVVFYSRHPAVFLSEDDLVTLDTSLVPVYALVPSDTLAARLAEQGFSVLGQRGTWYLMSHEPVEPIEIETEEHEGLSGEELVDEL
jgi:hypothetical protein